MGLKAGKRRPGGTSARSPRDFAQSTHALPRPEVRGGAHHLPDQTGLPLLVIELFQVCSTSLTTFSGSGT